MDRSTALYELKALADSGTFVQVAPEKFTEWFEALKNDKLETLFEKQKEFMEMLLAHDLLPEWPLDLRTKHGQRMIREFITNIIEELMEASFCLRNKVHKVSDDREFDFEHYREELGDALAYFLEVLIMSNISPEDIYNEYIRKNAIVKQRLVDGY